MGQVISRPLRAVAAGIIFAFAALSCTDGTGPESTLRLLLDTGTVTPGSNLQLTALDGEGEIVWTSDDPGVATVVGRTGWVTGVGTGSTKVRATDGTSEVTASIQVRTPPLLRVAQPTVSFESVAGEADPASQSLSLTNDGEIPLTGLSVSAVSYGVGEQGGWLTAGLSGTVAPAQLQLSASPAGLQPGTYTATLSVSSSVSANGPQSLAVTLVVLRPPSIELSTARVELGTTPGANSAPVSVQITNGGDRALSGLETSVSFPAGAPSGWLSVSLDQTAAPATLTLVALGGGLPQGQYSATVVIGSSLAGVASTTLAVDLVVAPGAAITLSSSSVAFSAVVGQASPPSQSVQVNNGGGGTLNGLSLGAVSYPGTGGWLSVSLSGTTAPSSITAVANSTGLAAGTYTASFTVSSAAATNSPRTISVTLVVDVAPVIAIFPPNWIFTSVRTKGDPPAQAIQITNAGGGTLNGLTAEVDYGGGPTGWLDLTLGSATGPTTLIGRARATGLAVGVYQATVTIRSTIPGVAPRSFTAQYDVRWSYQVDIQPFFTTVYPGYGFTNCTGCHFTGGNSPDLSTANVAYQALLGGGMVVPGNPNAGSLICKIQGNAGCGTAMPLPPSQIARIREWIAQGARY
jgi:hypothetical protein